MATLSPVKIITKDELMRLSAEDQWFEIVDGEIIPMSPTGFQHGLIATKISAILLLFVEKYDLGYVAGDGVIYVLRTHEAGVRDSRIPDVSFVRKERVPENFDFTDPFPGTPDLAVEVISPAESAATLRDKIVDYLTEGAEQVWVVYPKRREIHVYTGSSGSEVRIYTETDTLEADTLFPGLKIPVSDCFVGKK